MLGFISLFESNENLSMKDVRSLTLDGYDDCECYGKECDCDRSCDVGDPDIPEQEP